MKLEAMWNPNAVLNFNEVVETSNATDSETYVTETDRLRQQTQCMNTVNSDINTTLIVACISMNVKSAIWE